MKATVAGVAVHKVNGEWVQVDVAVGDEWADGSSLVRGNRRLFAPVDKKTKGGG